MKTLKVGIIGIRGLPAHYGAFDQFVDQFVEYSNFKKENIKFYISAESGLKKNDIINVTQFYFYRGKSFSILVNNFFSMLYFYLSGVRTFLFFGYGPVIFFPLLNLLNCKIICNVDGIEWRRKTSYIKKFYFRLCEKLLSVVKVNLIFDSVVIKRYYNIIHNVDGCLLYYPSDFEKAQLTLKTIDLRKTLKVMVVMRFLPENNIETIVDTFILLNKERISNDKLYIIGSRNEYFENIIEPKIFNIANIIFLGPIYDRKKLFRLWKTSDYYIHGHSVGGTNPTLIEAISLRLPVIAYDCSFNKKIIGKNGSFFKNSDDLLKLIKSKDFINQNLKIDYSVFKRDYINNNYLELLKSP